MPYGSSRHTNSWLLATADQGSDIIIWDVRHKSLRTFCRGSEWDDLCGGLQPGWTNACIGHPGLCSTLGCSQWTPPPYTPRFDSRTYHSASIRCTGKRLVCGGLSGVGTASVGLIKLNSDHGIHCLAGLASPVRKVWVSRNCELIAGLTDNRHVGIWRISTRTLLNVFEVHNDDTADCAGGCFDPTSTRFAFSAGNEAILYDVVTGDTLQRWKLQSGLFDQLQWDGQGRLLLLRREDLVQPKWRILAVICFGNGANSKVVAPAGCPELDSP